MNSTTKSKLRSILSSVAVLAFWLAVWQLLSMLVDREYFLPSVPVTLERLGGLLITSGFWRTALFTLLRVLAGLTIGVVLGFVLAVSCHLFSPLKKLLSPLITVIRSTPVATFIILLWIMMSGDSLAILIAVLMVMPIVWQNLLDGFSSIDPQLEEVAYLFNFSFKKKMKLLVFPALKKYLIPAIITSVGLGWKSEIAAEIIAYTRNSVGQMINDAKFDLDTPTVFAWTLVVVFLSIVLEKTAKLLLGRLGK